MMFLFIEFFIKTILQAYSNQKKVWYWQKNTHINQWKRLESPELDLCVYS